MLDRMPIRRILVRGKALTPLAPLTRALGLRADRFLALNANLPHPGAREGPHPPAPLSQRAGEGGIVLAY
jgi:hypothetical protein